MLPGRSRRIRGIRDTPHLFDEEGKKERVEKEIEIHPDT
jgi:hypothetical protein